jgi:hypothetical protein
MTTLDGDWVCSDSSVAEPRCFAIWRHCDNCERTSELNKIFEENQLFGTEPYYGGLVPKGIGLPFAEQHGNLWIERLEELGHLVDICVHCSGSGGGYCCGFHDLGITECEQS